MKPTAFTEEKIYRRRNAGNKDCLNVYEKAQTTSEEESKQVYIIQHPQGAR